MDTRYRFIVALLALLALTASVAEQAWGLACVGMERSSSGATATEHGDAGHAARGVGHPDAHAPASHDDSQGSDDAPCPMATASGVTCSLVATPALTTSMPAAADPRLRVLPIMDEVPTSLALSSLFRPPRR